MTANIYINKVDKSGKSPDSCHSIFRLVGKDENALTYSLGYLLAHDKQLCLDILKSTKILQKKRGKNWDKFLENYSIRLQEYTKLGGGFRDIVIYAPGNLRVVLEAKIGKGIPGIQQIRKYVDEFHGYKDNIKAIIALTRNPFPKDVEILMERECAVYDIKFCVLQWHNIIEIVKKHNHNKSDFCELNYLYDEFLKFIKEDYEMTYYGVEVKVQDVDMKNAEIYRKGWMYVGSPSEALYFAPYFTGGKGITLTSRVIHEEPTIIDDSIIDRYKKESESASPELKVNWGKWNLGLHLIVERAKLPKEEGGGFYGKNATLYFLDRPFQIRKTPLVKSKAFPQIPPYYSLRFDQLITLEEIGRPGEILK